MFSLLLVFSFSLFVAAELYNCWYNMQIKEGSSSEIGGQGTRPMKPFS